MVMIGACAEIRVDGRILSGFTYFQQGTNMLQEQCEVDEQATAVEARAEVRPKGRYRYLTAGEICYSRMVFKDAISYSRVKVYNREWRVLLGLQKNDTVMTPNGNIYYPEGSFREDFSVGGPSSEGLRVFMHEMAHVWQYQRGYAVKWNGIRSFDKSRYSYSLSEEKRLSDYNMEAQADLLADYFLLLKFGNSGSVYLSESTYKGGEHRILLPLYERVLADFLLNPHDESNFPGRRRCGR